MFIYNGEPMMIFLIYLTAPCAVIAVSEMIAKAIQKKRQKDFEKEYRDFFE